MLNQNHNVFKGQKSKSKIFITILCIFGLLFSWSCSCKNRVSDPNETPISGGTNKDPDPTPPPTPNNDPDKDLLNGDLSTTSTTVIVVASAGDSIKTTSTIKFKNATGKLTAIADVDASANTTLAVDDFDYTGTTLTFKKDTTDTSKYDKAKLDKVSRSGESKKVKATFELTPTSANATLTKTTQEVEIEIAKIKVLKKSDYADDLKKIGGGGISVNTATSKVSFSVSYNNNEVVAEILGDSDTGTIKRADFIKAINDDIANNNRTFNYFSKIEFIDEGTINGNVATFMLQFTLKDTNSKYLELEEANNTFTLKADITIAANAHPDSSKWE